MNRFKQLSSEVDEVIEEIIDSGFNFDLDSYSEFLI